MVAKAAAELILRVLTGVADARFRPGQWEAVARLVVDRGRVLVVQRTGWGKSAVYFLASKLLREQRAGPTLLISPLLALMRDQLRMAEQAGIRACAIHSDNREEWEQIERAVEQDEVDVLLVSPERLQNRHFQQNVLPHLVKRVGLLVVDEAHCISDWGHDFRPDYRRISRVVRLLPSTVPILCTTATANDRVVADIKAQLGDDLEVQRGPLDRESLALSVVDLPEQSQRLAWLAKVIPTLEGSGIVYCLTVQDTNRVAGWLRAQGIGAEAYSGKSEGDERVRLEQRLRDNEVKVLVASSALGMGFDKPDLAFVIHYQAPGSVVAYYQQVGRAGRGIPSAVGVLLRGREDAEIQDYFINTAFPAQYQADAVVGLLELRAVPMSVYDIQAEVNIRDGRLKNMLKVLEVDGAIEKTGSTWRRTLRQWAYDEERVEHVTAVRRAEQAAMAEYAATTDCRMSFLRRQLDDAAEPCGRCDNCTGEGWDIEIEDSLAAEAAAYLRRSHPPIKPRRRWPYGLDDLSGSIPAELQLEEGRALSVYGDGGWGRVVKRAKYGGGPLPDEVVEAAADLIASWRPEPAPQWVACVPSSNHPELVPDFAARLARRLGLEFRDVLVRTREGPAQKEMENSAQQFRNVYGAFEVRPAVLPTPVLLVDDIVDSGWTLTTIGVALREAGSGPVFPFALATAFSG